MGLVTGASCSWRAVLLSGTTRLAFLALGLTLPGLLLQDSWRFAFFALGRGGQAFLNDMVWAVALLPALVLLRVTGHANVFWFVFAWGAAAAVAAAVGPLQARVVPRLSGGWEWVSQHRDLGPRYLAEGTLNSAPEPAAQLRRRPHPGPGRGRLRAGCQHADGPVHGHLLRDGPGPVPEAARVLRRSPRHLPLFCVLRRRRPRRARAGLGSRAAGGAAERTRALMLGSLWQPTYPLVLPSTIAIMGGCVQAGAGTGLHALGAARRSLRAMAVVVGALRRLRPGREPSAGGAVGTMCGAAVASWVGALLFWLQLRHALRESDKVSVEPRPRVAVSTARTASQLQKTAPDGS